MPRWFTFLFLLLALLAGGALVIQREIGSALRTELALLREQRHNLGRLQEENRRLADLQPDAAELERLRTDRAALGRLRAEIESLRAFVEQSARKQAEVATVPAPPAERPPALKFHIGWDGSGGPMLDGSPLNLDFIRQRLNGLPKGEQVEFRLRFPKTERPPSEELKRFTTAIAKMAKESGLRFTMRFEPQ